MTMFTRFTLVPPLLVIAGCGGSAGEFVPPPPPSVTVQLPSQRDVTTYSDFTGRTEAVDTIEIRARVKGFLDSIHFKPSDLVEKGQLLFEIEDEFFQAAVDSARAEAQMKKAAMDLAQVTLEKAQAAYDKQALSDLEIRTRVAERDAAVAAYDAAQAAIASVELDLSYTKITSPVKGRVSRDYVNIGNLVGASEMTLLTIVVVDDPIYAYFNVDERFLLQYVLEGRDTREPTEPRERPAVSLQLTDESTYELTGIVDFAENRIDPETGSLQIRAVFDNPKGLLFPGMFARVRFPEPVPDALLVPELAIQRDLVGNYLLVVDEANVVHRRDVVPGAKVGHEVIITSGLEPNDRVIVNGLQRSRPGIEVNPVEAGAQTAAGTTHVQ
jgi:RND family efflux transporter MFP subunit